ncbi:hypothetical protein MUK42_18559 [Musa troglodytarum]|uniref:Uncharacterized protein n=1 Tax=Musa troglodytarum TaxID=320322 RepID=A0A9E7JQA5_9LILI|nr:hypothetical protein MUK42_18559 [Musa troglodytarum]
MQNPSSRMRNSRAKRHGPRGGIRRRTKGGVVSTPMESVISPAAEEKVHLFANEWQRHGTRQSQQSTSAESDMNHVSWMTRCLLKPATHLLPKSLYLLLPLWML